MINTQGIRPPRVGVLGRFFSSAEVVVGVLLLITVLVGGYFRFIGNNWDDFVRFHPDERSLAGVIVSLNTAFRYEPVCDDWNTECLERLEQYNDCLAKYPESGGRGTFFDTNCSLWHPENANYPHYVYGTLPLFMTRIAAEIMVDMTGEGVWLSYEGVFHVWRMLSAIAETVVIFMTFLIGVRLHGKWVGLLAAFLYAFSAFPIQQAHFGTVDAMATMFVIIALYFAVRAYDKGSWWDYGAFGLALGAAVASRVNVAPLAIIIVIVAIYRGLPGLDIRLPRGERNRIIMRHFLGVVIAAVASFIVFRLGQPYAFRGPTIFGILPDSRYIETLGQAQFTVSGELESPPNYQWVNRIGFLFPFQNMVLWGMGLGLGVTGWLSWVWSGWRLIRGYAGATRNLVLVAWILIYFLFAGNLWVMSMRYYLPLYSPLAVLAAWGIVQLVRRSSRPYIANWRRYTALVIAAFPVVFTLLWGLMFTNIYRHMATFTQASHWVWENVSGDFSMRIDDADEDVPLMNIALWNSPVPAQTPVEDYVFKQATRLRPRIPVSGSFVAPETGTISNIYAPHIGDPRNLPQQKTIEISIAPLTEEGLGEVVTTATLRDSFGRDEHVLGSAYELVLEPPLQVQKGQKYSLSATLSEGNTLIISGSVMAVQIDWEEVMPAKVCQLPGGLTLADDPPSGLNTIQNCNGRSVWDGLLNGYSLQTHYEDEESKRERLQTILDQTEYIMVPTNRRYDSQSRIPARWPMTNRFYDALFDEELGFELVTYFQETFEFGPFKVSDQHLPLYDSPAWLNEFEAEEAFHVYDHPVVFVFRKTEHYSSENTAALLNNTELTRVGDFRAGYDNPAIASVMALSSLETDKAPTHLTFPDEVNAIQREGGTWLDRFDPGSILNKNQGLVVVIWWLVVVLFGFVVWPLLFFIFPALADRGYGFSKFVGIMVVAWVAWFLASLRIAVWSQAGIFVILFLLAVVSGRIFFINRQRFLSYIRLRWRLLLAIEIISLLLFLVLIGVRLANPDLWHESFGGEKPMDFAYFNAVLRSTVFPPIDPWYAGGYINYYYFGFVIVGTPTLLLGIVPALAYNLIIPMLFSMTGTAAFSVAFSVVSGWRHKAEIAPEDDVRRRKPIGNPWVAGIVALLLAGVLGNLGTANEIGKAVAKLGGHEQALGLQSYLLDRYVEENDRQPDSIEFDEIVKRASEGRLVDRFRYELDSFTSSLRGLAIGIGKWLSGDTLYISPERWFWGPTRIIAEATLGGDGAINETPYFTFLYGDLHAHMIAMPMMLFAVVFVYNELMTAGRDRRKWLARTGAIFFGGLTVGLFQVTNTWDYPTFLILSVLGLGYAWWLHWKQITRWSLFSMFSRIGGLITIAYVTTLPYTLWFASALTNFKVWEGHKTPLWAYFTIHGVFLFIILSLLIWESVRWMRSVYIRDLRGKLPLLGSLLGGVGMILLGSLILAMIDYQVAIVVIPLVVWIGALFFRPGQSRPLQFVLVLAGLALAITLGTEVVTLSNDNGRQNTIFKFYIQVWLLLSIVGGAGFSWIISNSLNWRLRLALPFYGLGGILFFVAALYPIQATRGKAEFRFSYDVPTTLNGMEYMLYASHFEDGVNEAFSLDHDYNVIKWLQENVKGSPVIMEAQSKGSLYKWGGRISIHTGLPSVVGWDYHQRQQRSLDPLPTLVGHRVANVNAFYKTQSVQKAARILQFYEVEYVVLSNYEQVRYGPPDEINGRENIFPNPLDKFSDMVEKGWLTVVYDDGVAKIYQVNQDVLQAVRVAEKATAIVELGGE